MSPTKRLHEAQKERIAELRLWHANPDAYKPISTGVGDLDRMLNGGLPKTPFYFATIGDSKAGKSTVELNLTLNFCAISNEPVALYMLEEINSQVADRTLARASQRVSRSRIFQLALDEDDFEDMEQTVLDTQDVPYYVNDEIYDLEEIYADADALGVKRIVIDNFQLAQGLDGYDERTSFVNRSKYIMSMRKKGFTTFLVAQGNEKEGSFGSKQVFMDCDLGILIRRRLVDKTDKKSGFMTTMRELFVARSRFSQMEISCDVFFDGNHSRILQVEMRRPVEEDFIMYLDEYQEPGDLDD